MIAKLKLENFQIHAESELQFVPGVNIITGQSDNGKSSIIRALRWAVQNRPSGTSMVKKDAKDNTAARVFFAEGSGIARVRGSKDNYYMRRIDPVDTNAEKLQALRSDVPTEVSTVANISPHSIQGQHDPYFLLQLSPGEAAKLFGELADLSIITKTVSAANKYIKAIKDQQGELVAEEQTAKAEYYALSYLDEALPLAEQLAKDVEQSVDNTNALYTLETLVDKADAIKAQLDAIEPRLRAKATLGALLELAEEYTALRTLHNKLGTIADTMKTAASTLHTIDTKLSHKEEVMQCAGMCQQVRELSARHAALNKLGAAITAAHTEAVGANNTLGAVLQQFEIFKQQHPLCPVCSAPWGRK